MFTSACELLFDIDQEQEQLHAGKADTSQMLCMFERALVSGAGLTPGMRATERET